jgi:hypothetical protein
MEKDIAVNVEDYIQELIQDTPSSRLKLLVAWDGLSTETQIKILASLKNIPKQLKVKGLNSSNDYIRYLTAKLASFNDQDPKDKALLDKINEDRCLLVKYSKNCMHEFHDKNFEKFLSSPLEQQILYLSNSDISIGENFTDLILGAIDNKKVDEYHLTILVEEFTKQLALNNPTEEVPYSGHTSYCNKKSLNALWSALSEMKENKVAIIMADYLPTRVTREDVSTNILERLSNKLLTRVLYRHDVYISGYRKEIFFSTSDKYNREVKLAAASWHLNLNPEEFYSLIKEDSKNGLQILMECNQYMPHLPPVYIYALEDIRQTILNNKLDPLEKNGDSFKFFSKSIQRILIMNQKREK